MDIQNLIQQFSGGGNAAPLEAAAADHLESMAPEEVSQHLQTAANNANASGQTGVAQEIENMIASRQVDPNALKDMAIAYIKNNPQVLTHFAPSFVQNMFNRAS